MKREGDFLYLICLYVHIFQIDGVTMQWPVTDLARNSDLLNLNLWLI